MKQLYKTLPVALIALSLSFSSNASHIIGGDISYRCVGQDSFLVQLNLFRDCSGVGVPTNVNMDFVSSCGCFTQMLPLINPGGTEVSQLCPQELPNSTCNGGWLPGMEIYTYEGVVVLTPCADWNMSYNSCCRNFTSNIVGTIGIWIEATMNNIANACNSSARFTALPVPTVCINQAVSYNYGVVESDGDSLHFTAIAAREGSVNGCTINTTNAIYVLPYSPSNPFGIGFTLDPNTGQVYFTPNTIGNFVVVIQCEEYDRCSGQLLGTTMRDMQFVVINCTNAVPSDTSGYIQNFYSNGGIQTGSYSTELNPGDSVSFEVCIYDPDPGDIINLSSNITSVLPSATFSPVPGNPACALITWVATTNLPYSNSFTIVAEDDVCPVFGLQTYVYEVVLPNVSYAGTDQSICFGDTANLYVNGGNQFVWTAVAGEPINLGVNFSCDTCINPWASPDSTTTYLVNSNIGSCSYIDTITVFVIHPLNALIDSIGPFCDNDAPVALSADTSGGAWFGTGVNGPFFDPVFAGVGIHTIFYVMPNQGCPDTSAFDVVVNDCTGIEEDVPENVFSVYPNPTTGKLIVQFKDSETFAINDLLGRQVLIGLSGKEIDMSLFDAGIYYVSVIIRGDTFTRKVVLTK